MSSPAADSSDRFKRTRADHRDETAEDYVEAIADLIERDGEARVMALSEMMGVSHVTVSRIVARLERAGLVSTARGKPIELTEAGRALAENCRERHAVVLAFLRAIGVPEEQAQLDAEGIEHHVSDETIERFRAFTREYSGEKQ